MEIRVQLDTSAQIRAGIEPQQRVTTVNVPLEEWPQHLRDWLAERGAFSVVGCRDLAGENYGSLPTAVAEYWGQDPWGAELTECSPELALQLVERRVFAEALMTFFRWLDLLGKRLDEARRRADRDAEIQRFIAALRPEDLLTPDGLNMRQGALVVQGNPNRHAVCADGYHVPPELRPWLAELREQAKRIAEAKARERVEQLEAWIEQHMGAEALQRHRENYLPEEELCAAARKLLFAPFEDCKRYDRLTEADAEHEEECDDDEAVAFDVDDAEELSSSEYEQLQAIRLRAIDPHEVKPREHRVRCRACDFVVYRRSARVTMHWQGRTFTREYAL